jgi:hypothetical protein
MKRWRRFLILAGLMLGPGAAWAQIPYTVQPVVKAGDPIGALQIPARGAESTEGTLLVPQPAKPWLQRWGQERPTGHANQRMR